MGIPQCKEKDEKVLFSIKPAGWKKFMLALKGWKLAGKFSLSKIISQ